MGLKLTRFLYWGILFVGFGAILSAAPKLRLTTSAVGPISIVEGQNGPLQVVEAYNAGDGNLTIAAASSQPWVVPTVGGARPCTSRAGTCLPINLVLQTATLDRGSATAMVTVSDPNAVDAPQTISVTVQMGGGVPDEVSFFVAPNGSLDKVDFKSNGPLSFNVTTQSGGNWLSMTAQGAGTFDFVVPYRITGRHLPGLPGGTYRGTINITGSAFPPNVRAVPVTLQVTSQPIGLLTVPQIDYTLAADTLPVDRFTVLFNRGLGTLTVSEVTVTTDSGGEWLAAAANGNSNVIKVTADPTGVAPGRYTGKVAIQSNAVNGPHEVPVTLTVEAQATPVLSFQGVVNNATFLPGEKLPQGGIVALFGEQLSFEVPQQGVGLPLVKELGGAKVFVNGQAAPLYFSSYNQINFQLPYETAAGEARVQVTRDGQTSNTVSIQVTQRAPRILTFLGNYAIAQNPDGTFAVPPTPGVPSRPAKRGEVVVIYVIGFGQTSPPVVSGEAAPGSPLARVLPLPTVFLSAGLLNVPSAPDFVGLSPGFVGLYQINVRIPGNSPVGDHVKLSVQGSVTSNVVDIAIE